MLNGIAPILIFQFLPDVAGPTFNALSGVPVVGDFIADSVGLPIPLYLDEKLTGLYVENESTAIDIDTQTRPRADGKSPLVRQGLSSNIVTINMLANKDSILLAVLLALNDIAFTKLASQNYRISYFNGPTTLFNGYLNSFDSNVGSNDDLVRMSLQLVKKGNGATPIVDIPSIPNVRAATP